MGSKGRVKRVRRQVKVELKQGMGAKPSKRDNIIKVRHVQFLFLIFEKEKY